MPAPYSSGGTSSPLLLAAVALVGLGIGNATSLPPLVAQVEFAKQDVAPVVALIVATAQGIYAFAPAAFGLLREVAPKAAVYIAAAIIKPGAIFAYMGGRWLHAVRIASAERGAGIRIPDGHGPGFA